MKLLAYNINKCSQEKVDMLLEYGADVYVLPELACPSLVKLPTDYRMEWVGDHENKGLGIIWKSRLNAEIPQWFNPTHQYFLPMTMEGILIVAAWPTITPQNHPKKYPQIAMEALQEYACHLKDFPAIITGDMNCYKGQSGENRQFSIQTIFDFLHEIGFTSAYHHATGELLGQESVPTYYHRFNESHPFFIDYTFANVPLQSYQIGNWDRAVSDHVPQWIEIRS